MSNFSIVSNQDGGSTVTAFTNGRVLVADSGHPNYNKIVKALVANEPVENLFDIAKSVAEQFERVSKRVTLNGNVLYFDGDPVENELTDQVLAFMDNGLNFKPLV